MTKQSQDVEFHVIDSEIPSDATGIYDPEVDEVFEFKDVKSIDEKLKQLTKDSSNLPGFFNISKEEVEKANMEATLAKASGKKPDDSDAELKSLLNKHYDYYKERYGINVSYDTLESYLRFSQIASKDDAKLKELVTSELITVTSNYIVIKAILVCAKVLDQLLNAYMRRPYTDDLSDMSLMTMDKILSYIDKFEQIKKKYNIFDLDASINRIQKKVDAQSESDSNKEATVKLINILKNQLKETDGTKTDNSSASGQPSATS